MLYINGQKRITSDVPKLHTALYEIAQVRKYKLFLADFSFGYRGDFPFSREFDAQLSALEFAGHLCYWGFDYKTYNILPKMKIHYELYSSHLFSDQEKRRLDFMARDFGRKVRAEKER